MKLLLALTTLLAAALAAYAFPAMQKYLVLIPFALLALCLTACSTVANFERDLRKLPDGHLGKVTVITTNLGMEASMTAESLDKKGNEISAKLITANANTPWLGKQSLSIEDWSADVSPAAKAKRATVAAAKAVAVATVDAKAEGVTVAPEITSQPKVNAPAQVEPAPVATVPPVATGTPAATPSPAVVLPPFDQSAVPVSILPLKAKE